MLCFTNKQRMGSEFANFLWLAESPKNKPIFLVIIFEVTLHVYFPDLLTISPWQTWCFVCVGARQFSLGKGHRFDNFHLGVSRATKAMTSKAIAYCPYSFVLWCTACEMQYRYWSEGLLHIGLCQSHSDLLTSLSINNENFSRLQLCLLVEKTAKELSIHARIARWQRARTTSLAADWLPQKFDFSK